eukprot:19616-Pleurochrysis_carterae.AAC.1
MKLPKSLFSAAVSLAAHRAASLAVKASCSALAVWGSQAKAQQSQGWIGPSTGSWASMVRSSAVAWQSQAPHATL